MLTIEPIKPVYIGIPVTYVENKEKLEALDKHEGFSAAFSDNFAGYFGHFSPKGHQLVAEELAAVILDMKNPQNPGTMNKE